MSCGVGHRCGSDPTLLWQWCRPVATALVGPLAREPPYAAGAALKKKKRKEKKKFLLASFILQTLLGIKFCHFIAFRKKQNPLICNSKSLHFDLCFSLIFHHPSHSVSYSIQSTHCSLNSHTIFTAAHFVSMPFTHQKKKKKKKNCHFSFRPK